MKYLWSRFVAARWNSLDKRPRLLYMTSVPQERRMTGCWVRSASLAIFSSVTVTQRQEWRRDALIHTLLRSIYFKISQTEVMWREFLFKMGRSSKRPSESCSSDEDDDTCDSDSSGASGHYSFGNSEPRSPSRFSSFAQRQSDSTTVMAESSNGWREKFEFTLSLIREPRYLLAETLVAEQLKLTLKQQAYRLEQLLLHQTIQEEQQAATSSKG